MPKKKEPVRQRFCNGLIFGPEKIGKTHFLGTATFDERTAPFAILDFEGGVLDVLETMPGFGKDCIHIPVSSWNDFNEAFARLEDNGEGFKGVGIDSLSETHIFALMNILDEKGESRKNPDLIQQDDYGTALVQIRRLVRAFRDLPMHTFFTAHHKEEDDAREGRVKMVNLSGKAATEVPGMMSFSGYLTRYEEKGEDGEMHMIRTLLLKNHAKIRTGVRGPWGVDIPDEIDEPTVTSVLDALHYTN